MVYLYRDTLPGAPAADSPAPAHAGSAEGGADGGGAAGELMGEEEIEDQARAQLALQRRSPSPSPFPSSFPSPFLPSSLPCAPPPAEEVEAALRLQRALERRGREGVLEELVCAAVDADFALAVAVQLSRRLLLLGVPLGVIYIVDIP